MSTDVRALLFVLFCLAVLVAGCRCDGISPDGAPIQPTHTPTARPTSTPTIQPTSTPTPVGWPATMEAVLFGDEPCTPRCWQGITPGVSTEEDVLRILERLKTVGVVEDYDRLSPGSSTYWVHPVGVGKVEIRLEDGRVKLIEGLYLRIGYRAEQAIENFGEPEAVVPYYRMNDRFSCEEWHDFIATTEPPSPSWLLCPAQGITLILDTPAPGVICPQMFTYQGFSTTNRGPWPKRWMRTVAPSLGGI